MNWGIWIVAGLAYFFFVAWYFNWKGPMTPDEIDAFIPQIGEGSATDPDIIRTFLEEDDGKAFVMLNLVRFHPGQVAHPETGEMMSGPELVQGYFGPFTKAMLKRGGHPVLVTRKRGGYIDSWNTAADEGFHIVGAMRYRSRRDLVALVSDPRFSDGHKFKMAAIDGTTSFPTQVQTSLYMQPQLWVPLILLLLASLAQNAVFLLSLRG